MGFIESILSIFPAIKTVFLAIIPLGFLIFIHELGHFLAAKRAGIKVNVFSLGFGPKLLGFHHGGTDYRLSLLPFGGYVQMEGETPGEQTGAEDEFATASLGNRAFVVIAGPAVNLLFGILAYWAVFGIGLDSNSVGLVSALTGVSIDKQQEAVKIGWLDSSGPAAAGGLISGDSIVSINGEPVNSWSAFRIKIATNPNKELELVVKRNNESKILYVVPNAIKQSREFGQLNVMRQRDIIVEELDSNSIAANAGLMVGDQIETINGEIIYDIPFFEASIWDPQFDWVGNVYQTLYQNIDNRKNNLELGILRNNERITLTLDAQWQIKTDVEKGSTADLAGLEKNDVLISFNGKSVNSESLYTEIQDASNEPIRLGILRNGTEEIVTLNPQNASKKDSDLTYFGITWNTYLSGMKLGLPEFQAPQYNVFEALNKGIETTWLTFTAVGKMLKQLFSGEVSPKYLSGPVGIGSMTSKMFDQNIGITSVLFFIGFISINLCIVNLLPIPIADGGQLLFFAVEKIRGVPLPQKAQAIIQQGSVALLISLFVYITWYDILSLFYDLRN